MSDSTELTVTADVSPLVAFTTTLPVGGWLAALLAIRSVISFFFSLSLPPSTTVTDPGDTVKCGAASSSSTLTATSPWLKPVDDGSVFSTVTDSSAASVSVLPPSPSRSAPSL